MGNFSVRFKVRILEKNYSVKIFPVGIAGAKPYIVRIVYGINEIAESSFLMADLDRDGTLYVLRLEVDGEYWIPKNWKQ